MGRPFPTPWVHGRGGPCLTGDMDTVLCDYTDALIRTLNGIYGDESLLPVLPSMCLPPPPLCTFLYLQVNPHLFLPGDQVLNPREVGDARYGQPVEINCGNQERGPNR